MYFHDEVKGNESEKRFFARAGKVWKAESLTVVSSRQVDWVPLKTPPCLDSTA